jgi:cell division septation protein DedD
VWGCSSSGESEQNQDAVPPPPKTEKKIEQKAVQVPPQEQEVPKVPVKTEPDTTPYTPPEKQKSVVPAVAPVSHELPASNFSIQIGAFTTPEKADQWASLARTRFGKNVFTLKDEKTSNTKVLIGEFSIKEDARAFRDQIVQQFPDDYKDAWIFEIPHR